MGRLFLGIVYGYCRNNNRANGFQIKQDYKISSDIIGAPMEMEKHFEIEYILSQYIQRREDERKAEGVSRFEYNEKLNQEMLLLNLKEHSRNSLPKIEETIGQIKERLIAVTDKENKNQEIALGLFYTNLSPNGKYPIIAMGIFPLNTNKVEYTIRPPEIDLDSWHTRGEISLSDESATGKDPFLLYRPDLKSLNLLFFKRNPFDSTKCYYQDFPENEYLSELSGQQELTLEQNVIANTLKWAKEEKSLDFYIFKQPGFSRFIRNHQFGKEYSELYEVYNKWRQKNKL